MEDILDVIKRRINDEMEWHVANVAEDERVYGEAFFERGYRHGLYQALLIIELERRERANAVTS